MNQVELNKKAWWDYLEESHKSLLLQSLKLLDREKESHQKFDDYSFVIFPAAKAYEGFLKKLFLDLGIINERQYKGKHFRIGKTLNPTFEEHLKNEDWIYQNLISECNPSLPQILWDTWKTSRNTIFHWFPEMKDSISLIEAEERIQLIITAIDKSFVECNIKVTSNK